jgi:hypothetical protein
MEYYLASAVIGLGYMMSQSNNNDIPVSQVPDKSKPNSNNIFNSNRVQDIRLMEQTISDQRYDQALNNSNSNIIIPGPWETYYKKADYADNTLPVEFVPNPKRPEIIEPTSSNFASKKYHGMAHPVEKPVSGGHYGVDLAGRPIDPKNFTHNNMTPFFGSNVRQNVDELQNQQIVETFTGNMKYSRKKDEIPNLFDPQANVGLPYGSGPLTLAYGKERFIASNKRNNEAPTEKIYVGPGLNKGYTAQPSGGFQQANTRDYILPKTVDELRVKTNPKVTYYLPVIPGSHPNTGTPKIGIVQKNRPDTFAVWSPDRYFITTGDRSKPKQRAEVVLKHSNRATTDVRRAMGPAGPANETKESIRSNIKVSTKCQYTPGGPRNVDGSGQWTIPEDCEEPMQNYVPMDKCPGKDNYPDINALTKPNNKLNPYVDKRLNSCNNLHDYGRSGWTQRPNNRNDTACLPAINLDGVDKANYIPITQDLRPSRKQAIVGNTRWASNIQGPHNRHPVWDPNDIPRTTIKETTLQSSPLANVGIQRPPNQRVYDPNDIPRTTIKETTLSQGILGGAHAGDNLLPRTYDPTDVPRTTNKETTMTDYAGNAYIPVESGRESNCYDARNTNRQFTSLNEHFGNATGDDEGGYKIRTIDPRTTNRQYTSNHRYTGNVGNSEYQKPRETACMMDNVTTKSYRETLSRGRVPARQGPKDHVDPLMVNSTTKRAGDTYNMALAQRPRMSTKVYNSLPQANPCSETKYKKTLPNNPIRNRLDARTLDAFKSNPYTQSLSSYWTY